MIGPTGPAGTAPKDVFIASGMFSCAHRADPATPYLGCGGGFLKPLRQRLCTGSQCFVPGKIRGRAGTFGREGGEARVGGFAFQQFA